MLRYPDRQRCTDLEKYTAIINNAYPCRWDLGNFAFCIIYLSTVLIFTLAMNLNLKKRYIKNKVI